MGTSAFVAAKFDANTDENAGYVASYVHYDGYVEGIGQALYDNYKDDDAFKVANYGYMSAMPDTPNELDDPDFDKKQVHNYCAIFFATENEMVKEAFNCGCEYVYIWADGKWSYWKKFYNGMSPKKYELTPYTVKMVEN
jgi:hypothetical protein